MQDLPMQGSVALVAGASKGIGAATAEAFAAAGAAVVLAARDVAALKSVVQRIESAGGDAIGVGCDVSDVDSVRNLIDQAIARYGRPCPRRWPRSTSPSSTAASPPTSAAPSSG